MPGQMPEQEDNPKQGIPEQVGDAKQSNNQPHAVDQSSRLKKNLRRDCVTVFWKRKCNQLIWKRYWQQYLVLLWTCHRPAAPSMPTTHKFCQVRHAQKLGCLCFRTLGSSGCSCIFPCKLLAVLHWLKPWQPHSVALSACCDA